MDSLIENKYKFETHLSGIRENMWAKRELNKEKEEADWCGSVVEHLLMNQEVMNQFPNTCLGLGLDPQCGT